MYVVHISSVVTYISLIERFTATWLLQSPNGRGRFLNWLRKCLAGMEYTYSTESDGDIAHPVCVCMRGCVCVCVSVYSYNSCETERRQREIRRLCLTAREDDKFSNFVPIGANSST